MTFEKSEEVVYKHGKDRRIYTVISVNDSIALIKNVIVSSTPKEAHVNSLRIAEDEEIMVGYKLK